MWKHITFFCTPFLAGFMAALQSSLQHKYIDIARREHIILRYDHALLTILTPHLQTSITY